MQYNAQYCNSIHPCDIAYKSNEQTDIAMFELNTWLVLIYLWRFQGILTDESTAWCRSKS